ncbi:hypothetical protein G4V62_16545 [Bacillaceae bacterium SIJ1]|uniref:hypothetical protein n=1 Tax=Litoribacterium kuwaitense TaxID=1398745 RepID=UPI0013EDC7CC|nr:hypothetical protein [Litoribacterium kuwaitense]NGP46479.1 hypothetical protein [Litoribacterium kuwaitense]
MVGLEVGTIGIILWQFIVSLFTYRKQNTWPSTPSNACPMYGLGLFQRRMAVPQPVQHEAFGREKRQYVLLTDKKKRTKLVRLHDEDKIFIWSYDRIVLKPGRGHDLSQFAVDSLIKKKAGVIQHRLVQEGQRGPPRYNPFASNHKNEMEVLCFSKNTATS